MTQLFVAKETVYTEDGATIRKGDLAEEGALVMQGRENLFRPADEVIKHRAPKKPRERKVEAATSAPGETRSK